MLLTELQSKSLRKSQPSFRLLHGHGLGPCRGRQRLPFLVRERGGRGVRGAILVGESHSRSNGNAVAIATPNANANVNVITIATPNARHEDSSSSSTTTLSPNAMTEPEAEATPAIVPMYSAPSSPPSFTSSRSSNEDDDDHGGQDVEAGLMIVNCIKKLEAEVAETRQEVVQLKKRGTEMEMAVASLNAQLHRGLSKLAEMETDKAAAARRGIGGDTDVTATVRSERWGEKSGTYSEYLPSFSHALNLGEIDDELIGGRRRKAQKVKPIVPLIGDILISKRKSTKDKGDGFYNGDLYSVLG